MRVCQAGGAGPAPVLSIRGCRLNPCTGRFRSTFPIGTLTAGQKSVTLRRGPGANEGAVTLLADRGGSSGGVLVAGSLDAERHQVTLLEWKATAGAPADNSPSKDGEGTYTGFSSGSDDEF